MTQSNSKLELVFLLFLPVLGAITLSLSHFYFKIDWFDRIFPIIISLMILVYLAWQHAIQWDKKFFKKPYLSPTNLFFAVTYGLIIVYVLSSLDLRSWYQTMTFRTALFYFLPFILSAYVVPFLLFSHVLADSLDKLKRFHFIGSAHFIMALCLALWWIRQTF